MKKSTEILLFIFFLVFSSLLSAEEDKTIHLYKGGWDPYELYIDKCPTEYLIKFRVANGIKSKNLSWILNGLDRSFYPEEVNDDIKIEWSNSKRITTNTIDFYYKLSVNCNNKTRFEKKITVRTKDNYKRIIKIHSKDNEYQTGKTEHDKLKNHQSKEGNINIDYNEESDSRVVNEGSKKQSVDNKEIKGIEASNDVTKKHHKDRFQKTADVPKNNELDSSGTFVEYEDTNVINASEIKYTINKIGNEIENINKKFDSRTSDTDFYYWLGMLMTFIATTFAVYIQSDLGKNHFKIFICKISWRFSKYPRFIKDFLYRQEEDIRDGAVNDIFSGVSDKNEIENIFVEPKLSQKNISSREMIRGRDFLSELTKKDSRLVVVFGDPGRGKTALLKRMCLRKENKDGFMTESYPIYLNINRLIGYGIAYTPTDFDGLFCKYLFEEVLRVSHFLARTLSAHWLMQQRLTLLFDGLDEIPENQQKVFMAGLSAFCSRYDVISIVTSRNIIASVRNVVSGFGIVIHEYEISSYDSKGIDKYAFHMGEEFYDWYSVSPLFMEYDNPLIIGMAGFIFNEAKNVLIRTNMEVELYKALVSNFKRHRLSTSDKLPGVIDNDRIPPDDLMSDFCSEVAGVNYNRDSPLHNHFDRSDMETAFKNIFIEPNKFKVESVIAEVGLFKIEGTIYAFLHKTLCEFFGAKYMIEKCGEKCRKFLADKIDEYGINEDNSWNVVIRFYIGMLTSIDDVDKLLSNSSQSNNDNSLQKLKVYSYFSHSISEDSDSTISNIIKDKLPIDIVTTDDVLLKSWCDVLVRFILNHNYKKSSQVSTIKIFEIYEKDCNHLIVLRSLAQINEIDDQHYNNLRKDALVEGLMGIEFSEQVNILKSMKIRGCAVIFDALNRNTRKLVKSEQSDFKELVNQLDVIEKVINQVCNDVHVFPMYIEGIITDISKQINVSNNCYTEILSLLKMASAREAIYSLNRQSRDKNWLTQINKMIDMLFKCISEPDASGHQYSMDLLNNMVEQRHMIGCSSHIIWKIASKRSGVDDKIHISDLQSHLLSREMWEWSESFPSNNLFSDINHDDITHTFLNKVDAEYRKCVHETVNQTK